MTNGVCDHRALEFNGLRRIFSLRTRGTKGRSDRTALRVWRIPATAEDARIVRIENGRPRYGEEITERYLVQETGQMHAVHFSKGCYLGQEIVERVRSRAQIHRVLRAFEIDTAGPSRGGHEIQIRGCGCRRNRKRGIFTGTSEDRGDGLCSRAVRRTGGGVFDQRRGRSRRGLVNLPRQFV